jgi:hypothetical protein
VPHEGGAEDGHGHAEGGRRREQAGGAAKPLPLDLPSVIDGLALLDRVLDEPLDQGARDLSPSGVLLAADGDRAQHRRLQRGLVLFHVERDPVLAHPSPERKDQEPAGQGQQGDVGEDAEGVHGPAFVAEVVHRVGGHREGGQAGGHEQRDSAQRDLQPPPPPHVVDDASQLVVARVGHDCFT